MIEKMALWPVGKVFGLGLSDDALRRSSARGLRALMTRLAQADFRVGEGGVRDAV